MKKIIPLVDSWGRCGMKFAQVRVWVWIYLTNHNVCHSANYAYNATGFSPYRVQCGVMTWMPRTLPCQIWEPEED